MKEEQKRKLEEQFGADAERAEVLRRRARGAPGGPLGARRERALKSALMYEPGERAVQGAARAGGEGARREPPEGRRLPDQVSRRGARPRRPRACSPSPRCSARRRGALRQLVPARRGGRGGLRSPRARSAAPVGGGARPVDAAPRRARPRPVAALRRRSARARVARRRARPAGHRASRGAVRGPWTAASGALLGGAKGGARRLGAPVGARARAAARPWSGWRASPRGERLRGARPRAQTCVARMRSGQRRGSGASGCEAARRPSGRARPRRSARRRAARTRRRRTAMSTTRREPRRSGASNSRSATVSSTIARRPRAADAALERVPHDLAAARRR